MNFRITFISRIDAINYARYPKNIAASQKYRPMSVRIKQTSDLKSPILECDCENYRIYRYYR